MPPALGLAALFTSVTMLLRAGIVVHRRGEKLIEYVLLPTVVVASLSDLPVLRLLSQMELSS